MNDECLYRLYLISIGHGHRAVRVSPFSHALRGDHYITEILYQLVYHSIVYPIISIAQGHFRASANRSNRKG